MPIEIGKSRNCFQSNGIISNFINKLINRAIKIKGFQLGNKYSDLLESLILFFSHISNYKNSNTIFMGLYQLPSHKQKTPRMWA